MITFMLQKKTLISKVTWFVVLLGIVGFISASPLNAQQGGYYLLEYTASGIRYNTFAIDSGNGRGLMRVIYNWKNVSYLVEQKTTITTETAIKDGKPMVDVVLKGHSPRFIGASSREIIYYPDVIVLKRDKKTGLMLPDFVYSDFVSGRQKGTVNRFSTVDKNSKELEEALEKFKISNPIPAPPVITSPFAQATMQLVLLTNNLDQAVGSNFSNNHLQVKTFFKDVAKLLDIRFKSIEIIDNDFNKADVQSKLNFPIKQNVDILVFYYSGHGYCTVTPPPDSTSHDRWPGMILTNSSVPTEIATNTLKLKDVHDLLVGKNARLTMVFAECCNNVIPGITEVKPKVLAPALTAGGFSWNVKLVSDLFQNPAKILVATSRPTEFTIYSDEVDPLTNRQRGYGYFCQNFIKEFNVRASASASPLTWKDVLNAAATKTAADARDKGLSQHTMIHINP